MTREVDSAQKARDYLGLARDAFAARHGDAATITAVEDRLRQAISEAQPIRPAVENLLVQEARRSIASTLARGQLPNVSPATLAQIRFQTAYASLGHIAGLRALGREPELDLSAAHRGLLVAAAASNSSGGDVAKIALPPHRATEIAAQLAAVDRAGLGNPFAPGALRDAYEQHRVHDNTVPQRGSDRGR